MELTQFDNYFEKKDSRSLFYGNLESILRNP